MEITWSGISRAGVGVEWEEKSQGIRNIIGRHKKGRGRLRIV